LGIGLPRHLPPDRVLVPQCSAIGPPQIGELKPGDQLISSLRRGIKKDGNEINQLFGKQYCSATKTRAQTPRHVTYAVLSVGH